MKRIKLIERLTGAVFLTVLAASAASAHAQVVPSATSSQLSVTVGALGSAFQPDYAGNGLPQTSPNRLYGIGAFVDVKFTRWIQIEGEARWLRFNEFEDIYEDNYLVGPRIPIHHFHFLNATPYGKVLVGLGTMNFQDNDAYGRFTDIAYGAGSDFKVTRRISVRGDFEYQQWPKWLNSSIYPYGVSAGVSYKLFGGHDGFPRLFHKH
jgi:hypothetical protein